MTTYYENQFMALSRKAKTALLSMLTMIVAAIWLRTRDNIHLYWSDLLFKMSVGATFVMHWLNHNSGAFTAILAFIGLLFSLYFQFKDDKRKDRESNKE